MAENEDEEIKIDENPAVYRGKYTELELRERGIGKFHQTRTHEWTVKLSTYRDEVVKRDYMAVKRSLDLLCTDADGYQYHEIAHQVAQIMIDRFLLKRCKGDDVPVPEPVVSSSSLQPVVKKDGKELKNNSFPSAGLTPSAERSDFENWDGKIDTINDLNWIYNNLMVKDVKASDAPSPGAWAHLQYHRSSDEAMTEFFTKVYPRLIPAKGTIQKLADLFHDDGRTTFDLIDRLLAEDAASSGEIPVLPMVLPERAGLQDQAGQSFVPEKSP